MYYPPYPPFPIPDSPARILVSAAFVAGVIVGAILGRGLAGNDDKDADWDDGKQGGRTIDPRIF